MEERISVDPQICSGKPCISGTRVMVTNILGMLAGGKSTNEVLEAYPELTREDVEAALVDAEAALDRLRGLVAGGAQ